MSYLELLKLAAPEAIVVVAALAVLTVGLRKSRAQNICAIIAGSGLAAAIVAILMLPRNATLLNGMLVISPLNSLFQIIVLLLALATIPLATSDQSLRKSGEYLALILFGALGLMLLIGSEELLMIFIGLELLGLSLYVLTAFDKLDIYSAETGLKYFLFGSTASAFTLFGISLIYGLAGTTSLRLIAQNLTNAPIQPLLAAGLVMTLVGFAFKIAAAPFHLWAPDAYQGAPVPSAAFIASGSKVASFLVLGKIVILGFAGTRGSAAWHAMVAGWSPVLALLAALSILLGNFAALAQINVRRLLAYSAVAHAGYSLLGLVAGDRDGFSATLFYATMYAVTLIGAFAVVGIVRRATGGDEIQNFRGLSATMPMTAASMSIFVLSLAGLPPLAGFFGKFYLFSAALRAGGDHGLLWLVAVALFGSFVSLYYYLLIVRAMFVDPALEKTPVSLPKLSDRLVLVGSAAAVIIFGFIPSPLVSRILGALP